MNKVIKKLWGSFLFAVVATMPLQGMENKLARLKSIVTRPVNYVFGEEDSRAKTAFYATVGALVLAGGTYAVYCYGVQAGYCKGMQVGIDTGVHAEKERLAPVVNFLARELIDEVNGNLTFLENLLGIYKKKFLILSNEKEKFEREGYNIYEPKEYMTCLRLWREARDEVKGLEIIIENKKAQMVVSPKEKFAKFCEK